MNLLDIYEPGETPLPHADDAAPAIGIDLGTTHSVAAFSIGGKVTLIHNEQGTAIIPSAVYYGEEVTVGHAAFDKAMQGDTHAVTSIKRHMAEAGKHFTLGGKDRSPIEISADILRHMKSMAAEAFGKPVTQAVITVPAYFDESARLATKDAARLAGLDVLRLINEPTAAALAYGLEQKAEGIFAVYDLGGGTFDISILKLEDGVFQVLATAGDTQLGGDDIDQAIAGWAADMWNSTQDAGLLGAARSAKESLSHSETTILSYRDKTAELSLTTLNDLSRPLIAHTLEISARALADAQCRAEDLKGVVLVGGSTRLAQVREEVKRFFGQEPLSNVNPDAVVAAGAALQAEALTQGADHLLLDVIPLSLGLETMGQLVEKLIHRNTPIPVSVSQEFTTYQDGQQGMVIHVLQGEREMVHQNRSLAQFELKDIPPLPAGIARIKVTFSVDADGLLSVSAQELSTGKAQHVHVKPSHGLAFEEIERMLLESMQHAQADITERLLAEARMEAGRAIAEIESALRADAALLHPGENAVIQSQIKRLHAAMATLDRDRIDYEISELGKVAGSFAERRMNTAINKVLKGVKVDSVTT